MQRDEYRDHAGVQGVIDVLTATQCTLDGKRGMERALYE
ncbi:hypothetical protein KIPB_017295, partial [Kipferlia bialata]|eukprot:g17295.t1